MGWPIHYFSGDDFTVTGYLGPDRAGFDTLYVYLEGDGHAFDNPWEPASDPTPSDPIALRLALAHGDSANVLYLARPCQYTRRQDMRSCSPEYWTSHRFAPEVIDATDLALDEAKAIYGARSLVLIGYSGGGSVAVLTAARRRDVEAIVTVAALLDHEVWSDTEGLARLHGSLNPIDVADQLGDISQLHFVGADDEVVPQATIRSYMDRFRGSDHARMVSVEGFDHSCCWVENWESLLHQANIPD